MNLEEYIESGMPETYVFDALRDCGLEHPEELAAKFPWLRQELLAINEALENYALIHSTVPSPSIKPKLLATIDYFENINNAGAQTLPPLLNEAATIADFKVWLEGYNIVAPADFTEIYAKIISQSPEVTTAIVWIKDRAPEEVHYNEFERFLILEGSCTVTIEDELHGLNPGDFLEIPLHKNHTVTVTSSIPCKVILQRVAA